MKLNSKYVATILNYFLEKESERKPNWLVMKKVKNSCES